VRLVAESPVHHDSEWAAITSVAAKLGRSGRDNDSIEADQAQWFGDNSTWVMPIPRSVPVAAFGNHSASLCRA
jgi:hypothetical protein